MADKDFVVKNGLVVNTNVLVVNGSNVGINTTTPSAVFTVNGTANIAGNAAFLGNTIQIGVNSNETTLNVVANASFKANVFVNKKLFVGNTETMVQNLPTIIQAVDNFNGFVMVSSQNLSQMDDACADLLIYADNTNGLSNFNDLGINNSRFDGRIHRIIVNAAAASWQLGETVFQKNGAGANIAVGQIRDITTINSTAISLKIRVSEDDGLPTYVGMANFANTTGSNLAVRAVSSAANADVFHAVAFFSPEANTLSRRNYAFTIAKRGDGYLYNANSALTIGTTPGGIRSTTVTVQTSFGAGVNTITVNSGNPTNDILTTNTVTIDMDVTGTGIDAGTYVTSMINSTAFRISKNTTGAGSGTITLRDEYYDLTEANNPIIFHVGGMMAKDEIARFSGTGNFTIGPPTTSRSSKLTVNGTANLAGQTNVGANLNVTGNINASANVNAPRGIFSGNVVVGATLVNTTTFSVGNSNINAATIAINGNSTVATATLRSSNLTIGNDSVTDTALVRVQNSTSSANVSPGVFTAGISTVNATHMSVGANVVANSSTLLIGNASVNTVMNSSIITVISANATANIAVANLYISNAVRGQANFAGNVAITGNTNITGNVYAPHGVFATSANIGLVSISTSRVDVGANVMLDTAGLKITGNTLIPSMNVSGGNITVGNSTVANTPTIQLTNSVSSANFSPSGINAGNVVINTVGATINIGSNVWINSTILSMGNTTANVVIEPAAAQYVLRVRGNARVNGNILVDGDVIVDGTLTSVSDSVAGGDFTPSVTESFSLGNSSFLWGSAHVVDVNVPINGRYAVGNSSVNSVMFSHSVRVSNSSGRFANVNLDGISIGNSTANGQLTIDALRISNSTFNVAIGTASITIGNSSVNSTVNSSAFVGNVFAVSVNSTSLNSTSINSTSVNATSVNASSMTATTSNVTTANATTVNSTSVNATTVNTTNFFSTTNVVVGSAGGNVYANSSAFVGNVVAGRVNSTSINSTSINSTSINSSSLTVTTANATTVNATTVNAATFQVGTAFKANSTDVVTANLTINGNLVVTGTTTSLNTATLDVTDLNITVAKSVPTSAAADGAGLTVDTTGVSWVYKFASNGWLSNANVSIGNATINISANSTAFVGNVVASTINVSSNVAVGANVLVNTSLILLSNTISRVQVRSTDVVVGNSSVTSAPQVVVQNTAGTTTINSNFISTTSISGNLTGNVTATAVSATANVTVGASVLINTSAFSIGSAFLANSTLVNAVSYRIGATEFANTTGIYATHLGGTASGSYQLNSTLAANVATMTALNSTQLAGVSATNYVNTSANYTLAGNLVFNGNSTLNGTNNSITTTFRVVNASANVLLAAANGNFGVGNNIPAHKLRVEGAASIAGAVTDVTSLSATSVNANLTGNVIATTINATANVTVGANVSLNTSVLFVGNSTVNSIVNSTFFTGTANNTSFVGSTAAAAVVNTSTLTTTLADYQTRAGLSANVATLTSNNATYFNGQLSSFYQTSGGLSANVATLTSNNATYFSGQLPSYYANVTAPIFTTTVNVGSNVSISTSRLFIGNTTANMALDFNTLVTSNSTMAADVNPSRILVGNSTSNALINSTAIRVSGVVWGNNATGNRYVATTSPVGGSTGDIWLQYIA